LWPRMASRAMANTEYFFTFLASRMATGSNQRPARVVYH
jgi:hypothetical protein